MDLALFGSLLGGFERLAQRLGIHVEAFEFSNCHGDHAETVLMVQPLEGLSKNVFARPQRGCELVDASCAELPAICENDE